VSYSGNGSSLPSTSQLKTPEKSYGSRPLAANSFYSIHFGSLRTNENCCRPALMSCEITQRLNSTGASPNRLYLMLNNFWGWLFATSSYTRCEGCRIVKRLRFFNTRENQEYFMHGFHSIRLLLGLKKNKIEGRSRSWGQCFGSLDSIG
jgi:hypothetical protein